MKSIKSILMVSFILLFSTVIFAQKGNECDNSTKKINIMKSDLAIVIYSNDAESVWNALRLANFSLSQKDTVSVFLLGKGVEAQNLKSAKFDVKSQLETFVKNGGKILACGTCLSIRNEKSTELCPVSTMADLYEMIKNARKVLTF